MDESKFQAQQQTKEDKVNPDQRMKEGNKDLQKPDQADARDETNNAETSHDQTVRTQTSFDDSANISAFEATTSLLFDYIKEVEEKFIPDVRELLKELRKREESLEKDADSMTSGVGEQCSKIISHIETAKEKMTEEIKEDKEKRQIFIEERKKELTRVEENSEALLDSCKEHLMKGGKLMMDFFHEKCPTLSEMEREVRPIDVASVFKEGVIDVPELRKEIGNLKLYSKRSGQPQRVTLFTYPHPAVAEVDAKVIGTFSTMKGIGDILAVNSNEAWITDEDSYYITKYNTKGEVLQQVDSSVLNECFVMDGDFNFLICNYWESKIMKVTKEGNVSVLINDLPAPPTGICFNLDGDIVVCMQGYPWIPIYSTDGKVKKRQMTTRDPVDDVIPMTKTEENKTKIENYSGQTTSPYRVTQSNFGDYYVVDAIWPFKIVCLDMNGKFKWKYIVDQVENVYPYNICYTLGNELIVADVETQKFHVINPEGHVIRFISFQELGLVDAWSMSVDEKGRLWTGQDDGKVHIINLNLT